MLTAKQYPFAERLRIALEDAISSDAQIAASLQAIENAGLTPTVALTGNGYTLTFERLRLERANNTATPQRTVRLRYRLGIKYGTVWMTAV